MSHTDAAHHSSAVLVFVPVLRNLVVGDHLLPLLQSVEVRPLDVLVCHELLLLGQVHHARVSLYSSLSLLNVADWGVELGNRHAVNSHRVLQDQLVSMRQAFDHASAVFLKLGLLSSDPRPPSAALPHITFGIVYRQELLLIRSCSLNLLINRSMQASIGPQPRRIKCRVSGPRHNLLS